MIADRVMAGGDSADRLYFGPDLVWQRVTSDNPIINLNPALYLDTRYPAGIDQPTPASGTPLASWTDLSSSNRDVTQADAGRRPLWTPTGVTFDGNDDRLTVPVFPQAQSNTAAGLTCYTVRQYTGALSGTPRSFRVGMDGGSSNGWGVGASGSAASRAFQFHGVTAVLAGATYVGVNDLMVETITFSSQGKAFGIRANGGAYVGATNGTTPQNATGNVTLGGDPAGSPFRGTIAAVALFATAHSRDTQITVEQYLAAAFGVTLIA